MIGCQCAECTRLVPAKVPSTRRLQSAVKSTIVHERDRWQNRAEDLDRRVKDAGVKRRCFVEILCTQCGANLTVCSSVHVSETVLCVALELLATNAGWVFGKATAHQMGALVWTSRDDRDLCSSCVGTP